MKVQMKELKEIQRQVNESLDKQISLTDSDGRNAFPDADVETGQYGDELALLACNLNCVMRILGTYELKVAIRG